MAQFDFNNFLNTLNDKQKKAVLSCRTEAEFEQVIDDYDIEIPDEMLEDVSGGKGFAPIALAAIMALTGGIAAGAAISGGVGADSGSTAVVTETDHIRTEAVKETVTARTAAVRSESKQQTHRTAEKETEEHGGKHYGEMGYGYAE